MNSLLFNTSKRLPALLLSASAGSSRRVLAVQELGVRASITAPGATVRSSSTTTTNTGGGTNTFHQHQHRIVYIHPLSQLILEYLQDYKNDWIVQRGMDKSLNIHRDGSFELNFSSSRPDDSTSSRNNKNKNDDGDKIWTSYDEEDKKHWLTVAWGGRRERFLLQDNLMPLWNSNRRSLPERVHFSVDEMIRVIEQMEVLEQRR